ncbi:hypothetical protein FA13DRAFT_1167755 [Coprinellus micaceus]|uniref:Uncharacterized protein n=1 Tax=Coprinellus micaceus TaxID=71717 RepID=A0A4Y7SU63_COPMI|nr:hypothetical protein FA13DRAFT_1167755 [Coprinellus micaceus]
MLVLRLICCTMLYCPLFVYRARWCISLRRRFSRPPVPFSCSSLTTFDAFDVQFGLSLCIPHPFPDESNMSRPATLSSLQAPPPPSVVHQRADNQWPHGAPPQLFTRSPWSLCQLAAPNRAFRG